MGLDLVIYPKINIVIGQSSNNELVPFENSQVSIRYAGRGDNVTGQT